MKSSLPNSKIVSGLVISLVCAVFLLIVFYIDSLWVRENKKDDIRQITQVLNSDVVQLAAVMDTRLQLTRGLEAAVHVDVDKTMSNFQQIARELIGDLSGIISLQLAPDGIVTRVTDPENNRAIIGLNLFTDPRHQANVLRAKDKKQLVVEGPIRLKQGGTAIIARLPIFHSNLPVSHPRHQVHEPGIKVDNEFWGFVTVLISVETLLNEAGLLRPIPGVDIAISNKVSSARTEDIFYGSPNSFYNADASVDINLYGMTWVLAAKRTTELPILPQRYLLWVFAVIINLLIARGIYSEFRRKEYLQELIHKATEEHVNIGNKLKLEKDRLDLALQSANLSMWEANLRTGNVSIDKVFSRLIDSASGEQTFTVKKLLSKVPAHQRGQLAAIARDMANGSISYYNVEHQVLDNNGNLFWVHSRGKTINWDPEGLPQIMIGTNEDITDRKQFQEELHRAKEEASASSQAKTIFLANMSHELRTPLTAIIGYSEMLSDKIKHSGEYESLKDDIHKIHLAGQHLLQLINHILDLTKIEADKVSLENIPINLTNAVEDSALTVSYNATMKGLRLITYVDPALPSHILGDPTRLRQILINLASNAIKFSDKGEIVIRADLAGEDSGGQISVRFSVIDNGIGIAEENLKKLFQTFSQIDDSTSRIYGGTGLGLSICQGLVKMMGGEIGVNSHVGEGSEFYLTVPFHISEKIEDDGAVADLRGVSILMIVKGVTEQDVYRAYLEHWHAEVTSSEELETCYEQCLAAKHKGKPYNFILIGPQWTYEQQIEACNQLTRKPELSGTQFILLSSEPVRRETHSSQYVFLKANPVLRNQLLNTIASKASKESPELFYEEAFKQLENKTEQTVTGTKLKKTILIVDDNPTNRDVIQRQLNSLGYTCDMADDGQTALDRWRLKKYNVLLTDCHMPNIDGYMLTSIIRKEEEVTGTHTAIIAISADARQEAIKKCYDSGMDDFLSKPFTINKLGGLLKKWMADNPPSDINTETVITKINKSIPEPDNRANNDPIDERVLKSMFGDDPDIFKEILTDFVESTKKILEEITAGNQQHSAESIKQGAHKLKSAALSIGANKLANVCQSLEKAGEEDDWNVINAQAPSLSTLATDIEVYVSRL